jgi:hypothetical protein
LYTPTLWARHQRPSWEKYNAESHAQLSKAVASIFDLSLVSLLVEDQTGATKKRCSDEGSRLMPKAVPDIEGFKFSFWSNENNEPIQRL